uniref:Heme chaperone HemW n=1 Tax=Candidatus Kentrum sp. MB TaxID=2138164 RepID=A0A450X9Q1_9GAMM|nr:MAG: oxygen-independent coproporphyrinogen-3 oxidase [Candidatus Kentron sp. MB]
MTDNTLQPEVPINGIYLHIPYCQQLCYYCDFHFSLSLRDKHQMLAAIGREMTLRRQYLHKGNARNTSNQAIDTLYFGGGTPSILTLADIQTLLQKLHALFPIQAHAEITLEANPDHLTPQYLAGLKALGINRLSIGIQSFHDPELRRMNRRHTAIDALNSIQNALETGFSNITIDLIYGLPDSTPETFRHSLETALAFPIPHLSCYHLNIEERTAFAHFRKKGQLIQVSDHNSWAQYRLLCDTLRARGYQHYEISNFAQTGSRSRHNLACWLGAPYLGLGPSAHSFDGQNRQWNLAHNLKYREGVLRGSGFQETERLSHKDRFHEYLLTRLRIREGIDLHHLQRHFAAFYPRFRRQLRRYTDTDLVQKREHTLSLTEKGMFQSDGIIMGLMQD